MATETVRFVFPDYPSAVQGLLTALEAARYSQADFQITGLSPDRILREGLLLEGDIDKVSEAVFQIPGVLKSDF